MGAGTARPIPLLILGSSVMDDFDAEFLELRARVRAMMFGDVSLDETDSGCDEIDMDDYEVLQGITTPEYRLFH